MTPIGLASRLPAIVPAFDAAYVIERLEEAGKTLLSLPSNAPRLGCKTQGSLFASEPDLTMLQGAATDRPRNPSRHTPDAAQIDRMDGAFAWLSLIPEDKRVIRRVVALRCLVKPEGGRHCVSWRDVGKAVGASHEACRGWHATGIDLLVKALNARELSPQKIMAA